ncbi:hypothetical protein HMPREF1624_00175 [Sporothrix schenckii ATCC 58251]|uniref:Uncharacterized protein n=1 Tax=Sporothrix schenckii (strain ATCC 58251 / de Perez 2211183) TaxID=1391915 RepID=U7Q5B0_SPOS1|nr:hypothetical protein HMPREF1624_00175 [Sporothrix schenckii ATCC 58251]
MSGAQNGQQHHQDGQEPSPSGKEQELDDRLQNRSLSQTECQSQRQQQQHHHRHHHRASRNPARKQAAYEGSDASTPTRTRSTSSSNFTPLSTFPSATSRTFAVDGQTNLNCVDPTGNTTDTHCDSTIGRAEHMHVINNADKHSQHAYDDNNGDDDGNGSGSTADHVPFAQLQPIHLYPSSQQQHEDRHRQDSAFLSTPAPQPHSLLASPPQLCLRSRSGRSGNGRIAKTGVSSRSGSHKDSHSQRPSLEGRGGSVDGNHRDETTNAVGRSADTNADNDDSDSESLNSHALAWDQTCLRIAYLVSTMVAPSANASVGGGPADKDTQLPTPLAMARVGRNPGENGANGVTSITSVNGDTASLGMGSAEWELLPQVLDHFVDLCTRGWTGTEPDKKRRKIAQMLHWQNEVYACGKAAYCGCADGSPVPNDSLLAAALELPLPLQPVSATSSAPASVTTSAASASAPTLATDETVASIGKCAAMCSRCSFPLTPNRPIFWVADPKDGTDEVVFKKVRRTQEGPGDSIRKAIKSFRGLVFSKKNKRSVSSPAGALATTTMLAAPRASFTPPRSLSPSILDKATLSRRAWCQWEEVNCQRLCDESDENRALFFPQTAMYTVREEDVEVAARPASAEEGNAAAGSLSPSTTQARAQAQARAQIQAQAQELGRLVGGMKSGAIYDSDEDDEEYDPDIDDGDDNDDDDDDAKNVSAEQRRQRETNARLRRAERLLKKTNDAAATTIQAA